MFRHLIPNSLGPIMVALALSVVGRHPRRVDAVVLRLRPEPGRGPNDVGPAASPQSKRTVLSGYWWMVVFPCLALVITIVASTSSATACATPSIPRQTGVGRDHDRPDGDGSLADPETDPRSRADRPAILEIRDLRSRSRPSGDVQAVRGVDVTVHAGELLGVVGESGSGKSVTFLAAMGLLPKTAKIEGSVKVHGQELVGEQAKALPAAAASASR